jgi:hypothetical protein
MYPYPLREVLCLGHIVPDIGKTITRIQLLLDMSVKISTPQVNISPGGKWLSYVLSRATHGGSIPAMVPEPRIWVRIPGPVTPGTVIGSLGEGVYDYYPAPVKGRISQPPS